LWIVAGFVDSFGKKRSNARFTASLRISKYCFRSNGCVWRAPARVAVRDMRVL